MTTEAKGVGQRNPNLSLLCFVASEVEFVIYFGIIGKVVNSRMNYTILYAQNSSNTFHCSGSTQ